MNLLPDDCTAVAIEELRTAAERDWPSLLKKPEFKQMVKGGSHDYLKVYRVAFIRGCLAALEALGGMESKGERM